jgi:hypothetical protein
MEEAFRRYMKDVSAALARGDATEHTHRPALKALIEATASRVTATNEPKRVACGAPDYVVTKTPGPVTIGYVECKDVGQSLDEAEESDQLKRYLRSLENLVLTDYLEFRWYVDGGLRSTARLARVAKDGKLRPEEEGAEQVAALLTDVLSHEALPISSPRELAQRMARLTHIIRDTIVGAFEREQASDLLTGLRKTFAEVLIPDLGEPKKTGQFADMYAQTISYGLFAARCNHAGPEKFRRLGAAAEIPKTNPFLRQLFDTVTGVALDDEPYAPFVDDLVQVLAAADMEAVLSEFGKRTQRQDPVVHFYETFLATYDPKLREARGVYYTPEPVVSYIVRSVDHLLKTKFDLPFGLADYRRQEYRYEKEGRALTDTAHRLLILDPACGTGTFLYAVVDLIRQWFTEKKATGAWSDYVGENLLPRIFGFELLMAPYAVAHFKLGMALAAMDMAADDRRQWAYNFKADERLNVYLTNTLESAERLIQVPVGPYRVVGEEAKAAGRVKRQLPIMVIVGNPPYSGHSFNKGPWIDGLVRDYHSVDGQPLGERNPKWLQDDYVKFIRWAQWRIEKTGAGILGFITNHGYLDNPTFRGMRRSLMQTFDEIYVLDLHGNAKKKETCPDGSKDENVFDIQQGVAIALMLRKRRGVTEAEAPMAVVRHADLFGLREAKYAALNSQDVSATAWEQVQPRSPQYLFVPRDTVLEPEYEQGPSVTAMFRVFASTVTTARNNFAVGFDRATLIGRVRDLRDTGTADEVLREKYSLKDVSYWKLSEAREGLRALASPEAVILPYCYRPFDLRFVIYHEAVCERLREDVMRHMRTPNLALLTHRPQSPHEFTFVFCTRMVGDQCCAANKSVGGGNSFEFPLYVYAASAPNLPTAREARTSNLHPQLVGTMVKQLALSSVPTDTGDLEATFGPEDVFHYIYAILHSPTYRTRYAEFLKADFPRIPLTSDRDLFRKLCALGGELVAYHLLEAPALEQVVPRFPVRGDDTVAKGYPKHLASARVHINKDQYFDGVLPQVWAFQVGGYQVCEKWLKDRRGRRLDFDDLAHYQRVVVALQETIRLMAAIDAAIPSWPIQ